MNEWEAFSIKQPPLPSHVCVLEIVDIVDWRPFLVLLLILDQLFPPVVELNKAHRKQIENSDQ